MRILFLGDIVGKAARDLVVKSVPTLRQKHALDAVIVNGENSAGGFGITQNICHDLLDCGVDAITLGNHAFDQREALIFIDRIPQLVRPINYPKGTPGRGSTMVTLQNGQNLLVINVMGRIFMESLDDPFPSVDAAIEGCILGEHADAIVVDVHAEASSEKQSLGYFLDGRVSLVVGTHTHVPTADERILPNGTAFITDLGMCGDYVSVIGMDKEEPVRRFRTKVPSSRFEPAKGKATLSGVFVETDNKTGLAKAIKPYRCGPVLSQALLD